MGVLSDIIIANADEAEAINAAVGAHGKQWDSLPSTGIDAIKLWNLKQILAGQSLDDVQAAASYMTKDVLAQQSEDGPWIFKIPDELKAAVAALQPDAEKKVAAAWAITEEFVLDRWKPAVVEQYLHDLVLHARKAQAASKSLLLWMAL